MCPRSVRTETFTYSLVHWTVSDTLAPNWRHSSIRVTSLTVGSTVWRHSCVSLVLQAFHRSRNQFFLVNSAVNLSAQYCFSTPECFNQKSISSIFFSQHIIVYQHTMPSEMTSAISPVGNWDLWLQFLTKALRQRKLRQGRCIVALW